MFRLTFLLALVMTLGILSGCKQAEVVEQIKAVEAVKEIEAVKPPSRKASHAHIRHVTSKWPHTPGRVGLASILAEELGIANRHAQLAASNPADLAGILKNLRSVRHALDPSSEPSGPGRGYGAIRAADDVATHIQLAAKVEGASDNTKTHSPHVATSAGNIAHWGREVIEISGKVLAADSVRSSYGLAKQIAGMLQVMQVGQGGRTWKVDEGGLQQMNLHLGLLTAGEGM